MTSTARPNIVLIMQDQLRYDVVHDDGLCSTPAFDRLRAQGTALTRYYTPLGICSPARGALFTGRYPHVTGMINNIHSPDAMSPDLSLDHPTVAELLRGAGYRTGHVGKWHLGMTMEPDARGFDDSRVTDRYMMTDERFRPARRQFAERAPTAVSTRYRPPHPKLGGRLPRMPFPIYASGAVPEESIPATAVVEESIDLLRGYAAGDDPFFLVTSFIEPHWPNLLPERYVNAYDPDAIKPWANFDDPFIDKPYANQETMRHFGVEDFTWDDWKHIVAHYLGAVSFLDELTGRVIAALDDLGLAENTLLVVSCDHGDFAGSHRQFNKGALMYEEIYHIPCVARWPGVVAEGATSDALSGHLDLMPTMLAAAGVEGPERLDGHDLLPVLRGERDAVRDVWMSEFHGDEFGLYSQRLLRRGPWKLVYNCHDREELYHLDDDPHELHNLAYDPSYDEIRRDLEADLLQHMQDSEDPLRMFVANTLG